MKYLLLHLTLLPLVSVAQLVQRFDNSNYKALYFSEASKLIAENPGILVLDVRSPGEYADTSSYSSANIGRLKGARNISIDSIENHFQEIEGYKNKPILVYCSHSQRSRMVSKFLGGQGFTQVYSLNGGMSLVNKSTEKDFPGMDSMYISGHPYTLVQGASACDFLSQTGIVVVDLRPSVQFNGMDSTLNNNIGRLRNSINIPADLLSHRMSELVAFKDNPLLLVGAETKVSTDAAIKLKAAGFTKIFVLYEGLFELISYLPSTSPLRDRFFTGLPPYFEIGSREAIGLVKNNPSLEILDLRNPREFANKSDTNYHNVGHIKNAINLYLDDQVREQLQHTPRNTPILVYADAMDGSWGQVTDPNRVCQWLCSQGFKQVYFLRDGIYYMVWSVTNVENCRDGFDILVNHSGLF